MSHSFTILLFLLIPIVSGIAILFAYIKQKKKISRLEKEVSYKNTTIRQNEEKINDLETLLSCSPQQVDLNEAEKQKLAEKNRKLWTMSEAVYREKKKVDEEIKKIAEEKTRLEAAKTKLDEKIKKLWATSTAVHKEKERINALKQEIEQKHQEIVDSVNYAQRIQQAILPNKKEIDFHIPQNFIFFCPRDIVSGDFYWFSSKGNQKILACVDCTGHGVPGAFMSMIGNTLLNQIVNERNITRPDLVLNELNKEIIRVLKQHDEDSDSRDGMDLALVNIDYPNRILQYAGANRPLYIVCNGILEEVKADKKAIGGFHFDNSQPFNNHVISIREDMCIYLSTDGYADQFSPDDKKFMTKRFKELLTTEFTGIEKQHILFESRFNEWKKQAGQTDDVLVIGIKL